MLSRRFPIPVGDRRGCHSAHNAVMGRFLPNEAKSGRGRVYGVFVKLAGTETSVHWHRLESSDETLILSENKCRPCCCKRSGDADRKQTDVPVAKEVNHKKIGGWRLAQSAGPEICVQAGWKFEAGCSWWSLIFSRASKSRRRVRRSRFYSLYTQNRSGRLFRAVEWRHCPSTPFKCIF